MSLEEFVTRQSAWMSKHVERCQGMRMNITAAPAGVKPPWKKKRKAAGTAKRPPRKTAKA
jgi:DNA topoisomerase-3